MNSRARLVFYVLVVTTLVSMVLAACSPGIKAETSGSLPQTVWPTEPKSGFMLGSGVTAIRPAWPNQVVSPDELVPGKFYFRNGDDYSYLILATSKAYLLDGKCRYDYVRWDEDFPLSKFYYDGYCADTGLTAYDNGLWHRTNYLVPSDREPLTAEQFDAIRLFLVKAP